jgi:hypothetical protein
MADPPRQSDAKPHTAPRWVKVMAIVAIVAVLLVGILLLTGGHGPGRHSGAGGDTSPTSGEQSITVT